MKMKLFSVLGLCTILLGVLPACQPPAASGDVAISDKPRETVGTVNQADLSELVGGNNQFAVALYQILKSGAGNLFYSPYSISMALAMTYAGARGTTAQQMADTLHFTLAQDSLHTTFNGLDQELASRGQGAKDKEGQAFKLNIVNALWGQRGYQFLSQYLDLLAQDYGAGMRLMDFRNDPDGSRQTINKWVADQTKDKIQDLIPPGAIDTMTRLVLTNAIYFNAAWATAFDKGATKDDKFYLNDGSSVNVPMMHESESLGYAEGSGYKAVELPYSGNELSMVIFLPDIGTFNQFESAFAADKYNGIIQSLSGKQVALTMPRFKYDSQFSLNKALSDMGMPVAFTGDADFSGMTGNRDLSISDVIHKAYVAVDESGTEAAAATAVIMRLTAMPLSPAEVKVDHPFIFVIRDIQTGTVLFIGRVLNPTT
ncbi:MAG: serpin family protein [Dehalococcoidia bacterium]|jgi:serpin B